MNKVAILVGVSQYDKASNLPACKQDALLMQQLIASAGPFNDVLLLLDTQTRSSSFKSAITAFFTKHREDQVDELLFYFSGHGLTHRDDFFYILSDYDPARISTTCYSNGELDDTIRSLNPTLTVKIVDACQSGQQYVKDSDEFNLIFSGPQRKALQHLYFLFSSSSEQSSFADKTLSFFTKSLAEGIANHGVSDVRYKDLVDFAADAFQNNVDQKPFFVTQGSNTELFGSFTPEEKEKIKKKLAPDFPGAASPPKPAGERSELVKQLQEKAKRYLTAEELRDALEVLPDAISDHKFDEAIQELYEVSFDRKEAFDGALSLDKVGEFVAAQKEAVLAKPLYEHRKIHFPRLKGSTRLVVEADGQIRRSEEPDFEIRTSKQIVSYSHLVPQLPYVQLDVALTSKLLNLPNFFLAIVYVLTPTHIHLFGIIGETSYTHLTGTKNTVFRTQTSQQSFPLRELLEHRANLEQIMQSLEDVVLDSMKRAAEPDSSDKGA